MYESCEVHASCWNLTEKCSVAAFSSHLGETGGTDDDQMRPFWSEMWPDIRAMLFSNFGVFCVTFVVFPGILTKFFPQDLFLRTLSMGCFQLFDVIGRYLPDIKCFNIRRQAIVVNITLVRIVFIPT